MSQKKPISLVWVLSLLVCFLIGLVLVSENSGDSLPVFNGRVDVPGTQWYFGEKGGALSPVNPSERQRMEPGKRYVFATKIAYDGQADPYPSATFLVNHYGVRVYYEEQLVFHRTQEDISLPTVDSMGLLAFSIPLGYDCQGKTLWVELDPMLDTARERFLPEVQFGDYATTMRKIYTSSLPDMIVISAILFLCIALLLVGGVHEEMRTKCLNLALFAAAFAAHRLTESLFVQHISKSPYLLYLLNHMVLALLPIFLIRAYKGRFPDLYRTSIQFMEWVCWMNLGIQTILHFTGITDFRHMLFVTQLCCVLVFLSMVIPMVTERKRPMIRRVTVELIPMFVGAFLDFTIHFFNNEKVWYSMGRYISIGFLLTLIMVIYEVRKVSARAAAESVKSQFFQEMAYTDSLTGVGNRAAFDEEIKDFTSGKRHCRSLLCVTADLNCLKVMNDTYGHQEGDVLIQRCASLLKDCFQGQGRVFRIGGDEFSVFLYNATEADWPALKQRFEEERERRNQGQHFPLSVAIGCAPVVDGDIEEAFRLADERMYQGKPSSRRDGCP